jgi:hypothetical protein
MGGGRELLARDVIAMPRVFEVEDSIGRSTSDGIDVRGELKMSRLQIRWIGGGKVVSFFSTTYAVPWS